MILGDILIETSSDFLSAGALFRKGFFRGDRARVDWLAGYRYAQLQEQLFVSENRTSTDPAGPVAVGTTLDVLDQFGTWNEFHGADLGLQLWTRAGGWTIEVLGKIAIGSLARCRRGAAPHD